MPLIEVLRGITVHTCLYMLAKAGAAQIVAVIVFELAFAVYVYMSRVKASKIEHFLDLLNSASCLLFLSGQLTSIYLTNSILRQSVVGLGMAGVLVITIFANISYVLYESLKELVYEPLKQYCFNRSR